MPSKTKAQRNLMAAAAHNPKFAKKVGVPMSVAKEFNQADKGKKFKEGGMATDKLKKMFKGKESQSEELKEARAIKSGKITPEEYAKGEKMEESKKMKCGGKVKKYARGGGIESRGKTKGKFYVGGGMVDGKPTGKPAPKEPVPDFAKDKNQDVKNQKAYDNYQKTRKFARGGGIEARGKTKGRII